MTTPHEASGSDSDRPLIRWWAAMPRQFWIYSVFTAATMLGFATFGVLSFHMVARGILPAATVPLIYAVAMVAGALAALATGWAYDRTGPRILIVCCRSWPSPSPSRRSHQHVVGDRRGAAVGRCGRHSGIDPAGRGR